MAHASGKKLAAPQASLERSDRGVTRASVTLANGMLTVQANNSDLAQIVRDISQKTGMILEGKVRNAPVYGNYGPKYPSSILVDLLDGMGYNVMIVGGVRGGALKLLTLSNRTSGPTPPAPSESNSANIRANAASDPPRPDELPLGPGAIEHPGPQPPEDPEVRVQQNLQRLQQMHAAEDKDATPP